MPKTKSEERKRVVKQIRKLWDFYESKQKVAYSDISFLNETDAVTFLTEMLQLLYSSKDYAAIQALEDIVAHSTTCQSEKVQLDTSQKGKSPSDEGPQTSSSQDNFPQLMVQPPSQGSHNNSGLKSSGAKHQVPSTAEDPSEEVSDLSLYNSDESLGDELLQVVAVLYSHIVAHEGVFNFVNVCRALHLDDEGDVSTNAVSPHEKKHFRDLLHLHGSEKHKPPKSVLTAAMTSKVYADVKEMILNDLDEYVDLATVRSYQNLKAIFQTEGGDDIEVLLLKFWPAIRNELIQTTTADGTEKGEESPALLLRQLILLIVRLVYNLVTEVVFGYVCRALPHAVVTVASRSSLPENYVAAEYVQIRDGSDLMVKKPSDSQKKSVWLLFALLGLLVIVPYVGMVKFLFFTPISR